MKLFLKKSKKQWKTTVWMCIFSLMVACLGFTACQRNPTCYQRIDTAMGTVVKETVYVEKGGEDITAQIRQQIVTLEDQFLSRRKDSAEIYQINSHAGEVQGTAVSEPLWEILQKLLEVSERSGGAFDFTIGETVRLWDIDSYAAKEKEEVVLPSLDQIAESLANTGYEKLQFQNGRINLPKGMQLDLGAAGKGIACDAVLTFLRNQPHVAGAIISVGGSILTYGKKPDGTLWKVGIVDPQNPSDYIGGLRLEGQWCVSTSGDYERYVEVKGKRYHHIIDPDSGYPADAGLLSVTILTRDGMLSDALSTACFVLGYEESLELLQSFGAHGLFVDKQGNVMLTPGMEMYYVPR
ncbi:MAG: FAD:protein FMN transferase [Lachnospiraceae bacterium]|nr:FAD:protein FMN transferase [Lachnospiraceae bacterium]